MNRLAIALLLVGQTGCVTFLQAVGEANSGRTRRSAKVRAEHARLVREGRDARLRAHERDVETAALRKKRTARRQEIEASLKVEVAAQLAKESPLGYGEVVALLPIEAHGLEPNTVDALDALLFLELTAMDRFRFVPRRAIEEANREVKAASLAACVDARCAIEIGRALAAERVLVPRVFGSDDGCVVALTLYDLKTETGDWAATAKAPCEDRGLRDAATRLAKRLAIPTEPKVKAPMTASREEEKKPAAPKRPPRTPFTPTK
ncbi:MAG: hypothetical protein RMA76_00440 [Deltaproteobacteria bacterium]|jgi:hypothetical protein